jgi:hypothetical protein
MSTNETHTGINTTDQAYAETLGSVFANATATVNTTAVLEWIAAHPYQTFFHVVNGVILVTPAAATVPIFSLLGFSSLGPVAGSARSLTSFPCIIPIHPVNLTSSLPTHIHAVMTPANKATIRFGSKRRYVLVLFRASRRPVRDCAECGDGRLRSERCGGGGTSWSHVYFFGDCGERMVEEEGRR